MTGVADALAARYLAVLGLECTAQPDLAELSAIVRRHLVRIPFENVSKLLLFDREGAGRPTTLAEFLDGIEQNDLGGTCYSSNPFLAELLRALGYDAALLGADMSAPDVHTSVRVGIGGREYHVDVGYAAPLMEPVPLDGLPYEVSLGRDTYVLDNAPSGAHELSHYNDGQRRHGYVVHQPPRRFEYFHPVIVASFGPGRTFMRCLRITRFFEDGSAIELRNRRLLRMSRGEVVERRMESLDDLRAAVGNEFGMPRCPVEHAVRVLERLNGVPFFGDTTWLDSTGVPEPR